MPSFPPQQENAIKAVSNWFRDRSAPQVFRLFGYAGTGKAQPLDSLVQTPSGPRRMGDLAPGDRVCGGDGRPAVVTGVFPQGVKPLYCVRFSDGAATRCCDDHLWQVTEATSDDTGTPRHQVLALRQLLDLGLHWANGAARWRIPLCGPLDYDGKAPADPYVIGVLLAGARIGRDAIDLAATSPAVMDRLAPLLPADLRLIVTDDSHATLIGPSLSHHCATLIDPLRLLAEDGSRRIPASCLLASTPERQSLLEGLLDIGGAFTSEGRLEFTTAESGLSLDIVTLTRSLGGVATITTRPGCGNVSCRLEFANPAFVPGLSAPGLSSAGLPRHPPPSRFITGIERIADAEQQCIAVAATDQLYLTDDFIVTHNTTLARHLAQDLKLPRRRVLFGAFTGKAALVLRSKGCGNASTIHSMIYRPENPDSENPHFILNNDSQVRDADLVVIDECSMVGPDLGNDLLSFGTKLLVLGDPAQLPPVEGTGFFTSDEPDVMLTDVHRQARDNPIIRLSMDVRMGQRLQPGSYGDSRVLSREDIDADMVMEADQVLVGMNKTRRAYNRRIRQLKEIDSARPVAGDRLVCLRNNRRKGLLNGGIWYVRKLRTQTATAINMTLDPEDAAASGDSVKVKVHPLFFEGREQEIPWDQRRFFDEFDFGYALTVHKAQGSQWDSVMLFDESRVFSEPWRWTYTGLTRAARKVTIVMP